MPPIYTKNQRDYVAGLSVYDFMYDFVRPNVPYGSKFNIHTGSRCGDTTGSGESAGITVSQEHGYYNWTNNYSALDGRKGLQVVYALADYYTTVCGRHYDADDPMDAAYLIAEIAERGGVHQELSFEPQNNQKIQKPAQVVKQNMMERYTNAVKVVRKPIEVPPRAECGSLGQTPDTDIIRYLTGRGVDAQTAKDLIAAGLIYLSEAGPYYVFQKDENGSILKDENGKFIHMLDADGNDIFQTYVDRKTGEVKPKMQFCLVFVSKDKTSAHIFYDRKKLSKKGEAYIVANSSPAGYFGFTGHSDFFRQLDVPARTGIPRKAYICEAPIDAISLYLIHKLLGITEPAEYISISGAGKELAIQRAICEGYDCVLALDNDTTGKLHMDCRRKSAFIDPLSNEEVSLPCIVPPKILEVKDWNDLLRAMADDGFRPQLVEYIDKKEKMVPHCRCFPSLNGNPSQRPSPPRPIAPRTKEDLCAGTARAFPQPPLPTKGNGRSPVHQAHPTTEGGAHDSPPSAEGPTFPDYCAQQ